MSVGPCLVASAKRFLMAGHLISVFLLLLSFTFPAAASAQEAGRPLDPIIQKAVEVNNRNFKRIYNELRYSYTTYQSVVVKDYRGNIVYKNDTEYKIHYGGAPQEKKIEEVTSSTGVNKPGVAEKEKQKRESATRSFVVNYLPPFSDEAPKYYRYKLEGETVVDGKKAWVIIFYPTTYDKRLLVGKAYVDEADYHLLKYTGTPLEMPPFVDQASGTQYFTKISDVWVFTRVELEGTLRFLFWTYKGNALLEQKDYQFAK